MPLDMPKTNAQGFTEEEAAELEAAEQELAATEPPATETPEAEQPEPTDEAPEVETKPANSDKTRPPTGFVPQQALHEIRKELQEEREKRARMEGAWQQIQQRLNGEQKPQQPNGHAQPAQIPDYNTDPLGHLQGTIVALQTELASIKGQTQQQTQAQQQQTQYMQVMNRYANDWSALSRTTPDALDAYNWIKADAEAEIEARLPGITPEAKAQLLQQQEELIIANAYRNGHNPAQIVYDLAKKRGFKPKAAPVQEDKLARLQNGQKAAKSLSATKGAPNAGSDAMSLEMLSELMASPDEEDRAKADEMWTKMARRGML